MYTERTLESFLKKAAGQFPVMLVTGPRQVGKTTILQHLSKDNRTYVTLDDPTLAALAREEPALFLQRFAPPVLIDEIQYAPELLPHIKIIVDRERRNNLFWLTGSQRFQLMEGVTESLAGRVGIVNLLGLSQFEIQGEALHHKPFLPTGNLLKERQKAVLKSKQLARHFSDRAAAEAAKVAALAAEAATKSGDDLGKAIQKIVEASVRTSGFGQMGAIGLRGVYERIWRGAFPAVALNDEADRDLFYSSYIQTYLQRDVRDLANVGDESTFLKFLRAAAARTGQLLNMSDMARDAAVSVTTAKRWLSILEASGIIYLLEPYHSNVTKRLIKAPKLYFLDTGLCAYLTEWSSPETLEAGAMSGAILETFMFIEILKSYWHNGRRAPLYYYRDKDRKEIDLLIVQDETVWPLEFKKTASPDKSMVKNFDLLTTLGKPVREGGLVCLTGVLLPLTEKTNAIPVEWL
ncbi:MAG: ATP-binding protein [Pseudomonadota bacterium]|nr:ATP-binding protein [Pseudomonadota bacterium]